MKVCLSPLSRKGHDGFLGEKGGVILLTYPTTDIKTIKLELTSTESFPSYFQKNPSKKKN